MEKMQRALYQQGKGPYNVNEILANQISVKWGDHSKQIYSQYTYKSNGTLQCSFQHGQPANDMEQITFTEQEAYDKIKKIEMPQYPMDYKMKFTKL